MLIFFIKYSKRTKKRNTVRISRGELRSVQARAEYTTGDPTSNT